MDDERPTDDPEDSFFDKPGEGAPDPAEIPVAGTQPGAGVDGGISKPADYYSSDRPGVLTPTGSLGEGSPSPQPGGGGKAGCPTWAMGCGVAVTLIAIVVIGLVWWAISSGKMFTLSFESAVPLIESSAEIEDETKSALLGETETLVDNIEAKRIGLEQLQGPLTALQAAIQDQKIDQSEAQDLLETFRTLNERAASQEF